MEKILFLRILPGNPKYERGQDNKLIIWSQGHSTASSANSQSTEAAAPRLPYQRLLTRTSSSPADGNAGVRPVSSPAVQEGFPYQKLVRAGPAPLGCGHVEESAATVSKDGESGEGHQKLYQSLSLQRNPLVRTCLTRNPWAPGLTCTLKHWGTYPVWGGGGMGWTGVHFLMLAIRGRAAGGGRVGYTPLFGLQRDVPLDRVWFLASLS